MTQLMTADELLTLDLPGKSTELVRGRLVVREPPGTHHGRVQSNLNVLIDPARQVAHVYRSDGSVTAIASDGQLDGEGVVPGFSCAIAELFE